MAQQQEIELDTDNYEEQEIQVKDNVKDNTEDAKLESVDLGYTGHSDAKEEKATVKEVKEDNLQEHSDSVQKRINQLTRKMREAERREKAALDYAKGLQAKYQKVESTLHQTDDAYVKEYENRVDVETDKVKTQLRNAMEAQDYDKMMDANQNLTRLAVEKERAKYKKQELDSIKQQEKQEAEQQTQQPVQPEPSPRAQEWAEDNNWFGKDKAMTNAAFGIHEDLIQKGFDAESEEYYAEVDKQMRDYFPNKFVKERPVQTVASAGRKQQGRRTVKLTRSQVAIAKSLGVPVEEYAKYVKE
tara:strand:- start:232 stop:1134 length:903 start_codon:yes stop_codon:yes gene_type:complete